MIVYITHLTHECGVLGCTGRRAEVSSKSPQLVDRLRHLVPAMSLSADSNGGQAATIGWESSEPVAPLACLPASARGYLAYSPRQRSLLNTGGWISFMEWRPAGSFHIRHTSFPKNNLQVHLGSHQSLQSLAH